MKIRNGFVSNSSSSSFLIAVKVRDACEHCGREDPNLLDFLPDEHCECDDTYLVARGLDATIAELQVRLDDLDDDPSNTYEAKERKNVQAQMEECRKHTTDGYEVGYIQISYGDSMHKVLERLQKTGSVKMLASRI